MIKRKFWINIIDVSWKKRSIIWLSGVRRVGKTYLCRGIENTEYFDCELPSVRRQLEDTESFLAEKKGKRIIFDEIHRLGNPSELLKIAADYYPDTKIIATGSSTLGASVKFKDTLTGRKIDIWLTPMIYQDMVDFTNDNVKHRMLNGGLPPFFLSKVPFEKDYQEWMDSFWAKDIQELFRLNNKYSFQKFLELMMLNSGNIFEANRYAKPCEVSRGTISNYLKILETTYVLNIIRPYNSHRSTEIISAPKIFVFDTGFVCHYRGWRELRNDDCGILWEHLVLNEMLAYSQSRQIYYWRDKRYHEIDFIIPLRDKNVIAVECKWNSESFESANLTIFRKIYKKGDNFVIANDIKQEFVRKYGGLTVRFVNLPQFIKYFTNSEII